MEKNKNLVVINTMEGGKVEPERIFLLVVYNKDFFEQIGKKLLC